MTTKEDILAKIEELATTLKDETVVTEGEMNRLLSLYGTEQGIKNFKKDCNIKTNAQIDKLTERLSQQ